jgi:hypothetical protein
MPSLTDLTSYYRDPPTQPATRTHARTRARVHALSDAHASTHARMHASSFTRTCSRARTRAWRACTLPHSQVPTRTCARARERTRAGTHTPFEPQASKSTRSHHSRHRGRTAASVRMAYPPSLQGLAGQSPSAVIALYLSSKRVNEVSPPVFAPLRTDKSILARPSYQKESTTIDRTARGAAHSCACRCVCRVCVRVVGWLGGGVCV